MSFWLLVFLLLFAAPIGALLHELGHMIGALLVKADYVKLVLGSGRKIKEFDLKKVKIDIYSLTLIGGMAISERNTPFSKGEFAIITLGGPLLNLFVASVLIFFNENMNQYINIFLLYNIWLATINLIPFKIGNKQSDGFKLFFGKGTYKS